jgi:hypothetical protein
MSERDTVEFFGMYVPETKISGPEISGGAPTGETVTLNMHQFQFGFGFTRNFETRSQPRQTGDCPKRRKNG